MVPGKIKSVSSTFGHVKVKSRPKYRKNCASNSKNNNAKYSS